MAESAVCRACGSEALQDLGLCAPYPSMLVQGFEPRHCSPGRLLRCQRCGLGQRQPCLDSEALTEIYRQTPADSMDYLFEENAAWNGARHKLLDRFSPDAEVAVLDVGCHTGAFLAGLPAGWLRFGIESAAEPIQIASGERGVRIIAERLDTVSDEWLGRFDAVTLFDVVEHLPDPAVGLIRAAQLLRPGGMLIVSSGDLDAWMWRWLGAEHWYMQTPLHLSVVSRRFFESFAEHHTLELYDIQRIPHRCGTRTERWRETINAMYWGMRRRRGLYRLSHRLLQSIPGLGDLRHMQSVPWTMTITDHLLAVLTTPQSGNA